VLSHIQRLANADEFYLPAVYDFLFLDKYCLDTNTLRINATIDFPIIQGGIHVDTIVDTIPFPDFLHFIQTSQAFSEKALKFLICLQDPKVGPEEVRRYRHDLAALIGHYRAMESGLFELLGSEGLADTFDAIGRIDFVSLRYLEPHRETAEVNWTKLSRLNRVLMDHVKARRFTYYYANETTRRRISETTTRISIRCPLLDEPWPTISAHSMQRLRLHPDLLPHEITTIDGAYRNVEGGCQLREDISLEQRSALFQILQKVGMVSPDLSTVAIEIVPPGGRAMREKREA